MRLLERLLIDVIGKYVPDVDLAKLKVDILQQRASLSSVNLAPPGLVLPTFLVAGVPFQLAAPSTLDTLNLSLDGGLVRADAAGLVIHLSHVPYHRGAADPSVLAALTRATRTALAEAERHATGLFGQLLYKFLPVLMDKLQLTVRDVRIHIQLPAGHRLVFGVDEVRTESVAYVAICDAIAGGCELAGGGAACVAEKGMAPAERRQTAVAVAGDLAKDVHLREVSLALDEDSVLALVECVLKLRYRLGQYDVDLRVDHPFKFVIADALTEEMLALSRESGLWQFAAQYGRPRELAISAPQSWWRFAVRVIMRSRGCGHIAPDFGRSRLSWCVEYHQAHLERLNRGSKVRREVLESCLRLEDLLDVETVLLLRAKARKLVRTETASRFAAEDWLGWMLIGSSGNSGSDGVMADDIRAAVASLQEAQDNSYESLDGMLSSAGFESSTSMDKAAAAASCWTQAILRVRVSAVVVSVVTAEDNLEINLSVRQVCLRLEVDSQFKSYFADASIGNFVIDDGRIQYIRPLSGSDEVSVPKVVSCDSHLPSAAGSAAEAPRIFELGAERPPSEMEQGPKDPILPALSVSFKTFDEVPTANILVPGLAVHLDVARLSPLLALFVKMTKTGSGVYSCGDEKHALPLIIVSTRDAHGLSVTRSASSATLDMSAAAADRRKATSAEALSKSRAPQKRSNGMGRSSPAWIEQLSVSVHLDVFRLFVSSGLAVRDAACESRDGLVLDFSQVALLCTPFGSSQTGSGRLLFDSSLSVCSMANDTFGGAEISSEGALSDARDLTPTEKGSVQTLIDEEGFIRVLSVGEPILQCTGVSVSSDEGRTLSISSGNSLDMRLWDGEVESLSVLLRSVWEELSGELALMEDGEGNLVSTSSVFAYTPFTPSAWNRMRTSVAEVKSESDCGDARLVDGYRVDLSGLRLSASIGMQAPESVFVAWVHGLQFGFDVEDDKMSLEVRDITLSEPTHGGRICIQPRRGRAAAGLAVVSSGDVSGNRAQQTGPSARSTLMTFSDSEVHFSRESFGFLIESLDGVIAMVCEAVDWRAPVEHAAEDSTTEIGRELSPTQHCIELNMVRLRLKVEDSAFSAAATFTGVFLTSSDDGLAGHVDILELLDSGGGSGLHSSVISLREDSGGVLSDIPYALRFDSGPNHLDVYVGSVNIVLLRTFIEELVHSVQAITADVRSGFVRLSKVLSIGKANANEGSSARKPNGELGKHKFVVSIIGSHLLFLLPIAPEEPFTAGLDAPELNVTVDPVTVAIVGRRIALLANSSTPRYESQLGLWHRIVPSLDLDITRSVVQDTGNMEAYPDLPSDEVCRYTEEWRIHVAQNFVAFLTSYQVSTLTAVVEKNLLKVSDQRLRLDRGLDEEGRGGTSSITSSDESSFAECLGRTLYRRTVVAFDAPGFAINLLSDDDGKGSLGLALFSVGSLRFASDVLVETQPNSPEESVAVTVLVLDISSFQVDDRREGVPGAFRLVLNAEPSGDADYAEQDCYAVPCLRVKYHQKQSTNGVAEYKTDVRLLSPQVLFRSDFVEALSAFFSAPVDVDEGDLSRRAEGMAEASSTSVGIEGDETAEGVPVGKVSVVIETPQAFAVESPLTWDSRGVELSCDQIKVSVLLNSKGALTIGSHIRLRGLELALCSAQVLSGGGNDGELDSNEVLRTRMSLPVGQTDDQSLSLIPEFTRRHSIATTDEYKTSVLKRWANDEEEPVVLVRVRVLHVRPPTAASSSLQVVIPAVILNGTVQDIATLTVVASSLTLFPSADVRSAGNSAGLGPSIEIRLRDLECIVRIPQHRTRDVRLRVEGDGSSLLRAKLSLNVYITPTAEAMEFEVLNRGVRSFDGQTGAWDRRDVIEPFTLNAALRFATLTALRVTLPSPVCVNLGPVSVKTVAHFSFAMGAAFLEAQPASKPAASRPSAAFGPELSSPADKVSLRLDCFFSGFEVCVMSENLRVRAAVSEVEVQAELAFGDGEGGEIVVQVGSFFVKNEALCRRNFEHGRDWSVILSPVHDIGRNAATQSLLSLTSGMENLLVLRPQPVGFPAGEGQLVSTGLDCAPGSSQMRRRERERPRRITKGHGSVPRPVAVAVVQLNGSGNRDLEARFGLSGVDVCLDADVLSDLWSWFEMLLSTVKVADELHGRPFSVPVSGGEGRASGTFEPQSPFTQNATSDSVAAISSEQRSGRVAIVSRGFRLSARAPSSAQSSAGGISLRRAVELVAGSEYVSDIDFCLSEVDTDFLFSDMQNVGEVIRGELSSAIFSRSLLLQVARQTPSLVHFCRVGLLAYWRRNDTPGRRVASPEEHRNEGLLQIMDDVSSEGIHRQCIFERASMLDTSNKVETRSITLPTLVRSSMRRKASTPATEVNMDFLSIIEEA